METGTVCWVLWRLEGGEDSVVFCRHCSVKDGFLSGGESCLLY